MVFFFFLILYGIEAKALAIEISGCVTRVLGLVFDYIHIEWKFAKEGKRISPVYVVLIKV